MLNWSEEQDSGSRSAYNHVFAETPIGDILIEWKAWKERPSFEVRFPWGFELLPNSSTLEEAKQEAQLIWGDKIVACAGDRVVPPYTSCEYCGSDHCLEGEWSDGDELRCIFCGEVGVVAQFDHASGHTFWVLTAYDEDEES